MKYDRADYGSACQAARRASEADGRLRFVQATALGFAVTLRRCVFQKVWWTNGSDCGLWEAYAKEGRTQQELTQA